MAALLAAPLAAQNVTARVSGTVRDSSGAVMARAVVALTNAATGAARKVVTDSEGYFSIPDVQIGSYTLMVEMKGFKTYRQSEIRR